MGTSKGDPRGDPTVYGYPQRQSGGGLHGPLGALLLGLQQRRDRSSFVQEREQFITQSADRLQSIGSPEAIEVSESFRSNPVSTWKLFESHGGMGRFEDKMRERAQQQMEQRQNEARKQTFGQLYAARAAGEIEDEEIVPLMMQIDDSLTYSEALDIRDKMDELRETPYKPQGLTAKDHADLLNAKTPKERREIQAAIDERGRTKGGHGLELTYDSEGRTEVRTGSAIGLAQKRSEGQAKVEELAYLLGTLENVHYNSIGTRGQGTSFLARMGGIFVGERGSQWVMQKAVDGTLSAEEQQGLLLEIKSSAYRFRQELSGEGGARLTEPERKEIREGVGAAGWSTPDTVKSGLKFLATMAILNDERERVWTGEERGREFPVDNGEEAEASQIKLMNMGFDAEHAEKIILRLSRSFHLFDAAHEARFNRAREMRGSRGLE